MAGIIIADTIRASGNTLTLNSATQTVATVNATGIYSSAGNLLAAGTFASPTFSGTVTGTYTLGGTLTITAPVLSGTATGTYTLGGTPSLAATALTGTIAAARLPAGSVLQVVSATDSTVRSTASLSFVTASNTLSVTITPTSTSNKIFVIANSSVEHNTTNTYMIFTIYRGATNLGNSQGGNLLRVSSTQNTYPMALSFLDSPNSTSALTYQVYFKVDGGTATLNSGNCVATITAFEIAG